MPQLVVKIIGGKHIRHFTDAIKSPTDDATNSSEEKQSLYTKVTQEDLGRKSSSDLELLREEHTKNLLACIRQAPDRQCVTAPCGDRSGSYIHLKTNVTNTKQLLTHTDMLIKTNTESCLLSAISEELQGLDSQITHDIEEKLVDLDPSHSGIIHQSELTYLLLKQKIPLKLTTLSCLFKSFSDTNNPEQVHYKDLLEFIQRAADGHKHHHDEAEIWDVSVASTDLESVTDNGSITEDQKDSWLQRFHKMEMAMQMCDTKNTGYIDRDQAKRLLHNYSLIFNLNLSPLRINEVIRYSQRERKVHLGSVLQQLKQL